MLKFYFCTLALFYIHSFQNSIGNETEILESLNSSIGGGFWVTNILRKQRGSLVSWNYSMGGGFHHFLSLSFFELHYNTQLQATVFRISYNKPQYCLIRFFILL